MKIEVTARGAIYTNRFHGHYRTSMKLLASDLQGGCYNDSHPSEVTSVTVQIDSGTPKKQVDDLFGNLSKSGWSRERIVLKTWWPQ